MPRRGLQVAIWLSLGGLLRAQTATVPWSSYAHGPQHTGLSTIGAQRLEQVLWSTPVDLVLSGSQQTLYIHYGSPLITAANTVLLPVRTTSANTFRVEAHNGSNGALLYTLPTDYTPPPNSWIPSYSPALSQGKRLYYPGAGGTVYYRDQPDSASGPGGQIAFYGNDLYTANKTTFGSTVMISTPITADANGNLYFGFDVTGTNPANLTSGLARIGADGTGSWIGASAAAQGDASIVEVALNCAPAVSNDGTTVYFAVSKGPVGTAFTSGYLVSVNSTTLAPIGRMLLVDPKSGADANVSDNSSAAPVIGPDGDVYYGVLESPFASNNDRGWLLHFDSTLTVTKTPGAFGWDTTPSVVPAGLVPSYAGGSAYLMFTKYNNYSGLGSGNGQNKIAVLDPNTPMTDPLSGIRVMQEVITILGATLDPPGNTSGSVREWCINSGAIDPFSMAAMANSEDGTLYRWDFSSNSLIQRVDLTSGVGEAYTPTAIGADGKAYAINDGNLYAVGQASNLTIASSHSGSFTQGQNGATYTLTATNSGSTATMGAVTLSDTLPSSLTATAIGGTNWACTQPAGPCIRNDPLGAGSSYPAVTLTVAVGGAAPSSVTNLAAISSDGATNSVNSTAADVTGILTSAPALTIGINSNNYFSQGQNGAIYTLSVSNSATASPTSGTVTVNEMLPPSGLTLVSLAGDGWTCSVAQANCMRDDTLATGGSYSPIVVKVNVALNAPSSLINGASVSGGGSVMAQAGLITTVTSACDIHQNGGATLADVQELVNEALGAESPSYDLSLDGVVNVLDIQILIGSALGQGCSGS